MTPWPRATLLRLRRAERAAALRRLVEAQGRVAAGQEALETARALARLEALRVGRLVGQAGPPGGSARSGVAPFAPGPGPATRAAGEVACAVARARAGGEVVEARAGELRRGRAALALAVEALGQADAAQRRLEAVEAAWRLARWRRLERALEAEADDRGLAGPAKGGPSWGGISAGEAPPGPALPAVRPRPALRPPRR